MHRTTTVDQIEHELDALYEDYCRKVDEVAMRVFHDPIQRYFKKTRATFIPGNGGWYLDIRGYQLPALQGYDGMIINEGRNETERKLIALLSIEIPGMPGNDLGSRMDDYTPDHAE